MTNSTSSFSVPTRYLVWYCYMPMLIFGILGNILNIVMFIRKKLRVISCNNYFFVSAFSNLVALSTAIIPLLYMEFRQLSETAMFCKVQGYFMNAGLQISRYLILSASFDRFALCSANAFIRKFANIRIARRYMIPAIVCCWVIISLHAPIWISVDNDLCTYVGPAAQYEGFYSIVMVGTVPPGLMLLFSLLTFRNLKLRKRHRQVRPFVIDNAVRLINENRRTPVKDEHVLAMLLVQVVAYVISSTPYTISMFYVVLTTSHRMNQSNEDRSLISFTIFITNMLRFVCPFSSFYLFLLASKLYRDEMMVFTKNTFRQFVSLWKKTDEQNLNHPIGNRALSTIPTSRVLIPLQQSRTLTHMT